MKRRARAMRTRPRSKRMRTRAPIRRRRLLKRSTRQPVHHYKRYLSQRTPISGNVGYAPYLNSLVVAGISEVVNPTDFSALYDQYRINYVVAKFWLKIDPSAQTAATASFPKMYWVRDLDDSVIPGSLNEVRERPDCRIAVMNPNRPVVIKFKPNVLDLVYQSALASTYRPRFKSWCDMSNTNTPHYGVKFAIDDLTNTNYKVDFEIKLYFSCKQPK